MASSAGESELTRLGEPFEQLLGAVHSFGSKEAYHQHIMSLLKRGAALTPHELQALRQHLTRSSSTITAYLLTRGMPTTSAVDALVQRFATTWPSQRAVDRTAARGLGLGPSVGLAVATEEEAATRASVMVLDCGASTALVRDWKALTSFSLFWLKPSLDPSTVKGTLSIAGARFALNSLIGAPLTHDAAALHGVEVSDFTPSQWMVCQCSHGLVRDALVLADVVLAEHVKVWNRDDSLVSLRMEGGRLQADGT